MKTIIKKPPLKIMKLFHEKKEEHHLREIARKTGLNPNSAYRYLNQLEKSNLLESREDGNQKKFYFKKNKQTYLIFTYLDIQKMQNLPQIRQDALEIYFNALKTKPVFAIIFGSTAKKTFTKDSDIDILLVTNSKINTEKAEKEAEAITSIKVSTFQTILDSFKKEIKLKNDNVVQSAINTGYPVYNQLEYYEVINE